MYIVFEGIVGTGKTTQSKLLGDYLNKVFPRKKIIWTREPGGTEIADKIRKLVQGTEFNEKMEPECESYLYAASRAQTLRTLVKPNLDEGNIVISDRSFLSSLSYQSFGRGLGIKKVWEINKIAIGDILPDLILFLDLDIKTALSRTNDEKGDKFEKLDTEFFLKARQGYLEAGKLDFLKDRFVIIKDHGSIEEVHKRIKTVVNLKISDSTFNF